MTAPLEHLVIDLDARLGDLLRGLGEAVVAIKTFRKKVNHELNEGGDEAGRNFAERLITGMNRHLAAGFRGIGGFLGGLAVPGMWTGLIFGAAQAIAAVAPVVGVLGLIPAAALAGAAGLGTLIIAVHGVGQAIKASGDPAKYAEALKKLAPAARDTVRELVAMKPALTGIRQSVQQAFFTGFAGDLRQVAGIYLPLMRGELTGIAKAFNGAIREYLGWLKIPDTLKSIHRSLDNVRLGLLGASKAFLPFVSGLNDLVEVGSTFLPGLGAGVASLGDRFSEFMATVAGNGSLKQWIQGGLDALKLLGPLLKDVWGILHPIIQALTATSTGPLGFLGTLLHQLAQFFSSAQGMATLTALFATLNGIFGVLGDVLVALLPPLGQLIIALGPVLVTLLQALAPSLIEAANALAAIVNWITPFLPQLSQLAPAVTILAQAIMGLLVPAFIAWAVEATAAAIANIAATWEILLIIAAVAALGYGIYELLKHWKTVWGKVKEIAGAVGHWFVGVGDWFVDVWHHIVDAFKAGLAWVEAFPGRIWAALQTLPAFLGNLARKAMEKFAYFIGHALGEVVRFFLLLPGRIWHIITSLWNVAHHLWVVGFHAVVDFVSKMPGRIGGFFSDLWHTAKRLTSQGVHAVVDFVSKLPGQVWHFLQALPGKVWDAVKDAGKWLYDAGKNMIQGLINGAKSMFDSTWKTIKDFGSNLWHGFMDGIQGKSPSRLFMRSGESIVAGLIKGVLDNTGAVHAAIAGLVPTIGGSYGGVGTSFAYGHALGGAVNRGGGDGQTIHVSLVNRIVLDGKEIHAGLIQPAQRYKLRTGTTGLT